MPPFSSNVRHHKYKPQRQPRSKPHRTKRHKKSDYGLILPYIKAPIIPQKPKLKPIYNPYTMPPKFAPPSYKTVGDVRKPLVMEINNTVASIDPNVPLKLLQEYWWNSGGKITGNLYPNARLVFMTRIATTHYLEHGPKTRKHYYQTLAILTGGANIRPQYVIQKAITYVLKYPQTKSITWEQPRIR